MIWGLAGPKLGGYGIHKYDDPTMGWLQFLVEHGFKSTGMRLRELEDPARRERIAAFVAEHDMRLTVHPEGVPVLGEDADEVARTTDAFLETLADVKDELRVPIVTFGVGPHHRFMRDPSLEQQMDRLTRNLADLARGCHELGCPLGIENHGDYYCSDLVELCGRVKHLGIFLDTGNCYLIGERTVPACREAAPYTIGTHFKDHWVWPNKSRPLAFMLQGAPLGEGDVGLRQIYLDLLELNPAPEKLVMQWELIPPRDPKIDDMECLRRSWEFIRSLPEVEVTA